jgi:hypothetical protein
MPELEGIYADFSTSFTELQEGMEKRIGEAIEAGKAR